MGISQAAVKLLDDAMAKKRPATQTSMAAPAPSAVPAAAPAATPK
jgi:hypothetical protein